jgi:hypothetical protein
MNLVVLQMCLCSQTVFIVIKLVLPPPSIKLKNLNRIVRLYCSVVLVHKLFVAS